MREKLDAALAKHEDMAFALNDFLVANPEISAQEFKAAAKYEELLKSCGIEVESEFCGIKTAFLAKIKRVKKPKARFAILAEYDALPGIGHGCGHSASGSLSFLAALALRELDIEADIDLIGTPDEEFGGAKVAMSEAGAFKGYDLAMMIHLTSNFSMPSLSLLALSLLVVDFKGKPAHASACPWDGVNALNAAMLSIHGMDMLRGHLKPSTRIATIITQGGDAHNIVPERAQIEICIRSDKKAYLEEVKEKVLNCIKGACIATGASYEAKISGNECKDMRLNKTGIELVRQAFTKYGIPFKEDDFSMQGSSDIGNVSYECPALHPMMASSTKAFTMHSQEMHDAMANPYIKGVIRRGALCISDVFLSLLEDENKLAALREEFKKEA